MSSFGVQAAALLFWPLAIGTVLLPKRAAVLCLLTLAHIDPSGGAFSSATSVGFANLAKGTLFPAILLFRLRPTTLRPATWPLGVWLWIALCAYCAIGVLMSENRLAGVKMTVYLVDYFVVFLIFAEAWLRGVLTPREIAIAIVAAFALATLQTYVLGNDYGTNERRFTSFCAPQAFAAFMLPAFAVLVLCGKRTLMNVAASALAIVGVVLAGSRYVFLGTVMFVVVARMCYVMSARRRGARLRRLLASAAVMIVGVAALILFAATFSVGRLTGLASQDALLQRTGVGAAGGTFVWRLGVYAMALDQIVHRTPAQQVLGFGTSTGARLYRENFLDTSEEAFDANRIVHNEFLRSLYEWGVIGFGLLAGVITTLGFFLIRTYRRTRSNYALVGLATFPTMLLGLGIENVLSGPMVANGIAFSCAIGAAWAVEQQRRAVEQTPVADESSAPSPSHQGA